MADMMLDFANLEIYRENNRIEAKKAQGGLPHSIWETYSAFANSFGGILLLGVVEDARGHFVSVPLPSPERLVSEFRNIVNDRTRVSANILSEQDVQIVESGGNRIVVIRIPRAGRHERPVYIGTDPFSGSYFRDGEGDYRCGPDEVRSMLRDRTDEPQDALVLEELSTDCLDPGCVSRYRVRLSDLNPGPAWQHSIFTHFLPCIGAVARGGDGAYHPTAAGLLMFGKSAEIRREFPDYLLDYQELDDSGRLIWQLTSRTEDWSGSLFDFYFLVYHRILQGLEEKLPVPELPSVQPDVDASVRPASGLSGVRHALGEALANCLIHADYRAKSGLVILRKPDSVIITNPGSFRILISEAADGGKSDVRNATLARMFSLIHIGRGEGSGIPGIHRAWKEQGWEKPSLTEQLSPARITLTLRLKRGEDERTDTSAQKARKQTILEYLTAVPSADLRQISQAVELSPSRTGEYLRALRDEDIIVSERNGRKNTYRLKS